MRAFGEVLKLARPRGGGTKREASALSRIDWLTIPVFLAVVSGGGGPACTSPRSQDPAIGGIDGASDSYPPPDHAMFGTGRSPSPVDADLGTNTPSLGDGDGASDRPPPTGNARSNEASTGGVSGGGSPFKGTGGSSGGTGGPQATDTGGTREATGGSSAGTGGRPANATGGGADTGTGGSPATTCAAGSHDCGGVCMASDSTASCGASCVACPSAPTGGTATCDGKTCGYLCTAGSHLCNGACGSNNALATCGSSCTPCSVPANGSATCDGTSCGFTCNPGFHACVTGCVSNASANSCGASSCSPCVPPPNSTATCDGFGCGFVCSTGYTNCPGSAGCQNLSTDLMNCSVCGAVCPQPASGWGSAVCGAQGCDVSCAAGYSRCTGSPSGCGRSSWGFDDGTTQEFSPSTVPGQGLAGSISSTSARFHSGGRSLAIPVKVSGPTVRGFTVSSTFCSPAGGFLPATGKTVSMWLYMDGPALPAGTIVTSYLWWKDANNTESPSILPTTGSWFQVTTPADTSGTEVSAVGIWASFGDTGDWSGTVYVDDIVFR